MRLLKLAFLLAVAAGILAACATQPTPTAYDPPGFLMGLVHGIIAPFSLIAEVFTNVRVYAFPNSGGWYDFGFMLGVGALGGGSSRAI
jgi:hypothetical protein